MIEGDQIEKEQRIKRKNGRREMKALSCRPGEGNKRRADLRDDGLSCLPSAREEGKNLRN